MSGSCEMTSVGIGSPTTMRPGGSLRLKCSQDLLVKRPIRAAYNLDGSVAGDTLRIWGPDGERADSVPQRLEICQIVETHTDEVVWGGYLSSHYGHFLTETAALLWPVLPGARKAGRRMAFIAPSRLPSFVHEWLGAFGLEPLNLPSNGIIRFTSMCVPEPAWRLNAWISPVIRDIHLHVREHLVIPVTPRHRLLWLSRSEGPPLRSAHDERLLEWLLRDYATCIHPETLSLAEQVSMIENSDLVAGIVGSAFHTMLLAKTVPRCLYLCPSKIASAYIAQGSVVQGRDRFLRALEPIADRKGEKRFPGEYRVIIPEVLRELTETILPELSRDDHVAAILRSAEGPVRLTGYSQLEEAVAAVAHNPSSVDARRRLGEVFAAEGNDPCAREQFSVAAELADGER